MKITSVGCGFVGSIWASEFAKLCFAGELPRTFKFIDGDIWERRNAANQNVPLNIASEKKPKAETLADLLKSYERDAEGVHTRVTEKNIAELLGGSDLIIDAVDNIKTRQLLYTYGMGQKVPVLHIGITEQGTGSVEWSHPKHDTFALSPKNRAGKPELVDPETSHLPPCELASMRSVGWNTAYAAAMATGLYYGFDTWHWIGDNGASRHYMTEWQAHKQGFEPVRETWEQVLPEGA